MRALDLKEGQVVALAEGRKRMHALEMRAHSEPAGHWSDILDRMATINDLDWGAHECRPDKGGDRGTSCTEACERRWAAGLYCCMLVDGDRFRTGEYLHVPGHGGETRQRVRCVHMVGDTLRIREPWRTSLAYDECPAGEVPVDSPVRYEADGASRPHGRFAFGELRHRRTMPAWASRTHVQVCSVQACRVQEIDEDGARGMGYASRDEFRLAWHALHRRDRARWNRNPWVWVLGIESVKREQRALEKRERQAGRAEVKRQRDDHE